MQVQSLIRYMNTKNTDVIGKQESGREEALRWNQRQGSAMGKEWPQHI